MIPRQPNTRLMNLKPAAFHSKRVAVTVARLVWLA